MKQIALFLTIALGVAVAGCTRDEYVYHDHDHYRTVHRSSSSSERESSVRTLPGQSSHIRETNTPQDFNAQSQGQ